MLVFVCVLVCVIQNSTTKSILGFTQNQKHIKIKIISNIKYQIKKNAESILQKYKHNTFSLTRHYIITFNVVIIHKNKKTKKRKKTKKPQKQKKQIHSALSKINEKKKNLTNTFYGTN